MFTRIRNFVTLVVLLSVAIPSIAQVNTEPVTNNVSIGTNTFRGKFDVNAVGDIYLNSNTISGAGQALYLPGHIYIAPHTSASNISFLQARRSDNSGTTQLRIRTTNNGVISEAIHIDGLGNIGLSHATPNARLELGPSGSIAIQDNTQVKLRGGLNKQTTVGFVYDPNTNPVTDEIRITHAKDIYDRYIVLGGYNWEATVWTPQFRLNTKTGNVGIGTIPAADYKLAVNGKIWSTEVNVSLTVPGPDYVFEKDYSLPSLESVKSYIETNKHLPEVPSAKEMETNGINVSELNMTMLKKIEELTLYTIQLKEELDVLKAEMKKAR